MWYGNNSVPVCGEDGLVVSPYICEPVDNPPPPTEVALPTSLILLVVGLGVMKFVRRFF